MCFRSGPIDWRVLFAAMGSDEDLFLKCGYWCLEMVLQDAIQLYQTKGVEPYWSVIIDLENWSLGKQLPITQAFRLARKFLGVVPRVYPEILRRVVIIRAPWVFQKVWALFKPLFPAEIIAKISIHSGKTNFDGVFDILNKDRIPVSFGGEWTTEDGDEECRSQYGPGVSYYDGSLSRKTQSSERNGGPD